MVKAKWKVMAMPYFVFSRFIFCFLYVKSLCTPISHNFLIFCHHLLIRETNSTVSTTAWSWPFSFFFFLIHSATYHTILEAWLFPCIPMVISISSALINTISRGKKICFLFDFSHLHFYKSKTLWKSYLMPIRQGNP